MAELHGQVVAYSGLLGSEEAEMELVVVSSACRRRGIGTALIQHAISEAKKMKIRFLSIRPVARNEKAISLFAKLGFNTIGHIELFRDLSPASTRKWKSGITVHDHELDY